MAMTSAPPRALITAAAAELLHDLQRRHGPVIRGSNTRSRRTWATVKFSALICRVS